MNVVFIALDRFLSIKEPYAYRYTNLYNAAIEYSSYALVQSQTDQTKWHYCHYNYVDGSIQLPLPRHSLNYCE